MGWLCFMCIVYVLFPASLMAADLYSHYLHDVIKNAQCMHS